MVKYVRTYSMFFVNAETKMNFNRLNWLILALKGNKMSSKNECRAEHCSLYSTVHYSPLIVGNSLLTSVNFISSENAFTGIPVHRKLTKRNQNASFSIS